MDINKGDIKVLLVDDDPSFRRLLDVILEIEGYSQIRQEENGSRALDLAREYRPGLVLMDTNMPGPYGYEVCQQMRQEDYGQTAAIIGMSGNSDPELERKWLQAGADDFFEKGTVNSAKEDFYARILAALEKYQQ